MLRTLRNRIRRILYMKYEFDEYVSYWIDIARKPLVKINLERFQSDAWVKLAKGQYDFLKWAGLRENWIIIEIGCGDGKIPYMLYREKAIPDGKYYGLDIIEESISTCRKNFSQKNFHYQIIKNNELNFKNNFADCIFLMSVFTHVNEDTIIKYLMQIRRILKPYGVCIFTVHLTTHGQPERVTIPIAQYHFEHINKIVRDLGFLSFRFARYPPPGSDDYSSGYAGQKFGFQFPFIVSKEEINNPELIPI